MDWSGMCAAGSSEAIPMFRGNFFPKRYPFFAIFPSAGFTFARALGQDKFRAPSIGLGRTWGNLSNCE